MTHLPADPLAGLTLADLAASCRQGRISAEAVVSAYLERIARLDPGLGAYQHVAAADALAAARDVDREVAAGRDPGPLAGVPIAVKDIFAVDGMPTTAGSKVDVSALIGSEGSFVRRIRKAGAIILGKTKTVEFAFGATGINLVRGTPWNPADPAVHRVPGGSSSGSAVAVAAGLAAFGLGSDTGGSVRVPAALCGVFGLKTTWGLWPTDGVFPLSPTFDSVGLLTRSAADAALVFAAVERGALAEGGSLAGTRLARPVGYAGEIDPNVEAAFEAALDRLVAAGATITELSIPEARERESIFPVVLAYELMQAFGVERFAADRDRLDPVVATRMARALETSHETYAAAVERHRVLTSAIAERMAGIDALVSPATAITAPAVDDFRDAADGLRLTLAITRNTQPANLFGQCAVTIPLAATRLPSGLQLAAAPGRDAELLALALLVEAQVGRRAPPDVAAFAGRSARLEETA